MARPAILGRPAHSSRPAQSDLPGETCQGWQHHRSRTGSAHVCGTKLLPALQPHARAKLRSQSGPHAAGGLATSPARLARRVRVETRVTLQQRASPSGETPYATNSSCQRSDGSTPGAEALANHCWAEGDLALRSASSHATRAQAGRRKAQRQPQPPLQCYEHAVAGRPQLCFATRDGAMPAVAERRKRAAYPELLRQGPQRFCVLAREAGGRWDNESFRLVTQFVRRRSQRVCCLGSVAAQGWLRRSWGNLSVALQSKLAATLLGAPFVAGAMPGAQQPALADVLHDASPHTPSRLGLYTLCIRTRTSLRQSQQKFKTRMAKSGPTSGNRLHAPLRRLEHGSKGISPVVKILQQP